MMYFEIKSHGFGSKLSVKESYLYWSVNDPTRGEIKSSSNLMSDPCSNLEVAQMYLRVTSV